VRRGRGAALADYLPADQLLLVVELLAEPGGTAPAVAPLLPSGISTALILATSYVEIYRKGLGRKEVLVTGDISSWALEYFKKVLFIIIKINPRELLVVTNKKT
jgi:hypothetical protein